MALTHDELDARIAAIDEAIARGEQSVQFSDRLVTYRSVDQLFSARAHFASLLANLGKTTKQTLVVTTKGF